MHVYSKKIMRFIGDVKETARRIISREMSLKVHGDRFYNYAGTYSYPIHVVVYNNKKMLGYFCAEFYELGFHECLMHVSQQQLHAIIRHELAHYMTFISHGACVQPHGMEFRAFCQKMGWGEEVYAATTCLDDHAGEGAREEHPVLRKVQKLMALSSSSNQHEAELAMIKSQQLLMKHHLDAKYFDSGSLDDEKMVLKRILKQKKENAKMRAIAKILQTFFVNTVFSRGGDFIYLEILGSEVNVEVAEYVADYLDREFDILWELTKTANWHLKGMVAKNSFFIGIAMGYCNKIDSLKKAHGAEESKSLMVIEKQLIDAKEMAYRRLRTSKSGAGHCAEASALGEQMGRKLNIHKGVGSSKQSDALLSIL